MIRFLIYFSTVLIAISFISCTGSVDSETMTIDFENNSIYESHEKGGVSPNNVVIVHTEYNAVVKSNGLLMKDTTYTYSSMFLKITPDVVNAEAEWQKLYNFGSDTNITVVKRDTYDSIFVNYSDSLYIFDLPNATSPIIQLFNPLEYPTVVIGTDLDSDNENDSLAISVIDSLNTYSKSYDTFKQDIINMYE